MKRKSLIWLMAALFTLSALLAGCGGAKQPAPGPTDQTPGTPQAGGTLRLVSDAEPKGFNPLVTNETASSFVQGFLFANLVTLNERGEPVPVLVEAPPASPDGKTWTFTLKEGLKWSDGQPLTTDDVVFTINSMMDPNLPGSPLPELWKGRTITAENDRTFTITVPEPHAAFPVQDATIPILPKHKLDGVPVGDWPSHAFNQKPDVFSGPFKLESYSVGQPIVLSRNDDYALGAPKIETVTIAIITENIASSNSLLAGELDWAPLSPDTLEVAKGNDSLNLVEIPDLGYQFIGYNLGTRNGQEVPFFKDVRVRQAIAYAVDKTEVVKAATGGVGVPVEGPILPVLAWAYPENLKPYPHDVDKAKALLDEAGWKVGSDGIREKDGVKFSIKLPVRAGKDDRIRAAQLWAAQLKEVGIAVDVTPEDFATVMLPRIQPPFDYDAIFMGWGITADPDQYQVFHSSQIPSLNEVGDVVGGSNFGSWKNAEADRLIEEGRVTTDQTRRAEIYKRLSQIFYEEQPYYFLFTTNVTYGMTKRVQGPITPSPWGQAGTGIFWNIEQWYLQ